MLLQHAPLLLLLGLTSCSGSFLRRVRKPARGTVDVLFSADKRMMIGLRTAVYSTLRSAKDPDRFRIHLVVDPNEADAFRKMFGLLTNQAKRTLPRGASLELHFLNTESLRTLYRTESSDGGLREDCASNYARIFIDSYLPADSVRAVWLDADLVVERDVADLADLITKHPSKSMAFARYPGAAEGFSGNYSVWSDVTNRSWALTNLSPDVLHHPVWNVGVLGFNMPRMREHPLRNQMLKWIQLAQDVGLATHGGSQTPLDLAALVHPNDPEDPFIEIDPTWNCWWGFLGALRTEKDLDACKVIHFAGNDKPWNAESNEHISDAAFARWATAEQESRSFFS